MSKYEKECRPKYYSYTKKNHTINVYLGCYRVHGVRIARRYPAGYLAVTVLRLTVSLRLWFVCVRVCLCLSRGERIISLASLSVSFFLLSPFHFLHHHHPMRWHVPTMTARQSIVHGRALHEPSCPAQARASCSMFRSGLALPGPTVGSFTQG